ncbi:pentapeptide repeat-containing protein [Candidatus Amarolinea dominans]|uniref:WD40 domain-containing protein n=1 Tax=Candidatus Amarolinea dominans TaxID=3140696 RepID=UPI003136FB65|nr:pentapeptide repeat-containing protein [Anaerolineae bacterium]
MPADWNKFAELLTDLLYRIKDVGGLTIAGMQLDIGHRMGKRGGDLVAKWRQGLPVARRQDIETLAQTLAVFAQNAGLPPAQFRADLHTLLTLAGHPHPDAVLAVQAQPVPPLQAPYGPRAQPAGRADWGRAPDVSRFVGRAPELAQLDRWLLQDRRRLLGVFGLGGIGKTFLTRRAALDAAPGFTAVKWVLLQDGPPPDEVLAECIHFFSGYRDTDLPPSTAGRLDRLLAYFRQARCLLILDKLEAIMQPGRSAGHFRAGYEAYGDLLGAAAETEHRSCLVVIGREQPHDMARWEVQSLRAASLHLRGMDVPAAQAILQDARIAGAPEEWAALVAHYAGNPLMLQLAAAPIRDLYAGRLDAFLAEERFAFGDVNDLLDEHFGRLATGEQDIMHWLAVERTALAVTDLVEHLLPRRPVGDVRSTLASLLRRHLTDRDAAGFFLQDIVLEYVTDRLVARMADELMAGQPDLFRRLPLLNPVAAEHRRLGQERFLAAPLVERLRQVWPATAELRQRLGHLAAAERSARPPGYTAGNALNLLRHAQADLTGADFSGVSIWRAFLRGLDLHRVNLARADLRETVFTEAFASVAALGLSQDGALLAAGADSGEIYLWRCRDFKRLFTLKGHNDWVRSVAFSPDGRLLASASSDKTIRLWDVLTGDCLRSLAGHENRVRAAVFSPDGTLLASASSDRTVRLWRVADGRLLHTLTGHAEVAWAARFSATGRWLASSSYDRTIRLWDGQTGEPLRVLDGHADAVLALAFHPIHDHLLASGSDDRTVRLWDARDGACLHVFADHGDMVRSVTFSPDGAWLASGGHDRRVRVRCVADGSPYRLFEGHHDAIEALAFAPGADAPLLYVGSHDQTIHVWDIRGPQRVQTLQGRSDRTWTVAWHPQRAWLATAGSDGRIRVWDLASGACRLDLPGHTAWVQMIAFSPDGGRLVSCGSDKTVRLWDTADGRPLASHRRHSLSVVIVAWSPDGRLVASGSEDSTVCLWQPETGELVALPEHPNSVRGLAFSADGRWLASCDDDGVIRLWDMATRAVARSWMVGAATWALAFDPRGGRLASGSHDGVIRLWEVESGACIRSWDAHTELIADLAYHPDGGLLVSASYDATARLWDAGTGAAGRVLHGETRVPAIAFSPDGRLLAGGSHTELVRIWDVATGAVVQEIHSPRPYDGLDITGVAGLTDAEVRMLKQLGAVER